MVNPTRPTDEYHVRTKPIPTALRWSGLIWSGVSECVLSALHALPLCVSLVDCEEIETHKLTHRSLCDQTDVNVDIADEAELVQSEEESDDSLKEVPCSYDR